MYHHDNLKDALVKRSVEIIATEGIEGISMRRLALDCGVSRGAPYCHFESKDELLEECRNYIADIFTDYLENSIKDENIDNPDTLSTLGYAYINFFRENPSYYNFIYFKDSVKIIVSLEEVENNYPPFEVLRRECMHLTKLYKLPFEKGYEGLVRCWSVVHGAASLVCSPNVTFSTSLEEAFKGLFDFK